MLGSMLFCANGRDYWLVPVLLVIQFGSHKMCIAPRELPLGSNVSNTCMQSSWNKLTASPTYHRASIFNWVTHALLTSQEFLVECPIENHQCSSSSLFRSCISISYNFELQELQMDGYNMRHFKCIGFGVIQYSIGIRVYLDFGTF